MILTKSISRFARNTVDTLNTLRILRKKGVTVFFEKEHIDTHADNGEMIITVLSGLAQEESFNLSENTRWGIIRKFENGTIILNHNRFMGYTKGKDGELAIVPEEAETVRLIFRMYLEGTSIAGIKRHLEKEGILTVTGRKIWNEGTISKMLSNGVEHGTEYCKNSPTLDEEALQRAVMRTVGNVVRDSEFGSVMQNNVTLVIGQYADSIQSENNETDEKIAGLEREMLQMVNYRYPLRSGRKSKAWIETK